MNTIRTVSISRYLAVSVSLIALTVIAGWYANLPKVVQIHPTFVAMQFNTALCFLLVSLSVICRSYEKISSSTLLAAIAFLVGLGTFIEYIGHVDLYIDQLFMEHYVTTNTTHPGRMAISTALCFLMAGFALIVHNNIPSLQLNKLIGPAVSGMGFVAFVGYLFNIETAYGLGNLSAMALHTSINFILIGVAITLVSTLDKPESKLFGYYWKESSLSVALIVFTFALSQAVENWQKQQVQNKLNTQTQYTAKTLKVIVENRIKALNRMATRWQYSDNLTQEKWQIDSLQYVADFPEITAIEWVDNNLMVRWIVPLEGNEMAVNYNLSTEKKRYNTLRLARTTNNIALSPTVDLIQGERGFLIVLPLTKHQQPDGYLLGVIAYENLLQALKEHVNLSNINLSLTENAQLLAQLKNESKNDTNYVVEQAVNLKEGSWELTASYTQAYTTSIRSRLPEIVLISGFGAIFLTLMFLKLWRDTKKNAQQLISEIKQHKKTKALLSYEENRLRTTLETMVDGVVLADQSGKILNINQAASTLFGYQDKEIIGQNVRVLMPDPDRSQHDSYLNHYLRGGTPQIIGIGREVTAIRKNGKTFPIHLSIAHMKIEDKDFFSAIIRDISLQKETQLALAKYMRELERSNEELSEFAYIASHDLKAPLRGIMQLSNWIDEELQDNKSPEVAEYIKLMQSRTSRLEGLLNDLLSYATLTERVGELAAVDIETLIDDIFQLLNPPPEFKLNIQGDVKSLQTMTTPLEQIFRNLINNAIKHHDKESGTITVTSKKMKNGYQFSVCDDGPGIEPQFHKQIFGIFKTLKPRDELEGSGMGLAIVKKLLDSYDCSISIESNGATGTCFIFTWPENAKFKEVFNGTS
ncbi:PAS domain S-box protein [Thalassotalea sediminis]|uniref:PAS domain S-box protein n=1 Tax=Thalassotalea sediminis TaxID=1759089 RepID=UPI0025732BC8|nr:PAS domain S-box protein [Thalassotalea sediminis]